MHTVIVGILLWSNVLTSGFGYHFLKKTGVHDVGTVGVAHVIHFT